MTNSELIKRAKKITKVNKLSDEAAAGEVGAALITDKGNVYTGVSIHTSCSVGFCAECAAIAEMLKKGESRIRKIVALNRDNIILPPCGRCREMIYQINHKNTETDVVVGNNRVMKLKKLLPERWQEKY